MAAKSKTIKDYCQILGVSQNASPDEVRLAYVLMKREIQTTGSMNPRDLQEAYEALSGGARRGGSAPAGSAGRAPLPRPMGTSGRLPVSALGVLGFALSVLAVVVVLCVWPIYGYRLRSFGPNDSLVESRSGRPFGTIVEVQAAHVFPNGRTAPAYLVKLAADGHEVWYPRNDIAYLCERH